jgi:hypothetical protein
MPLEAIYQNVIVLQTVQFLEINYSWMNDYKWMDGFLCIVPVKPLLLHLAK